MSKIPAVLPEGTTHFCPAFGRYPTRAFKRTGYDRWAYWTGFDWHDLRMPPVPSIRERMIQILATGPSLAQLIDVQVTGPSIAKLVNWNGPDDGLPPVGLEIEVLWSSACGNYVKGVVVGHDEGRAVFRFTTGEREGEYQAERNTTYNGGALPNFRPIRTAEQLAAEEREKWAQAMFERLYPGHEWRSLSGTIKDRYRTEYDTWVKP